MVTCAAVMHHWETPDRIRIVSLPAAPGMVRLPALSVTVIDCEVH